jgi:hypothetical protein
MEENNMPLPDGSVDAKDYNTLITELLKAFINNGDGTYSLKSTAQLQAENINIGDVVDVSAEASLAAILGVLQPSTVQTLFNGSANANGSPITIGSYQSMLISIDPAATITAATITFQKKAPDGTWVNANATPIISSSTVVANNTISAIAGSNELWSIPTAGYQQIRVVVSGYAGSGAINISGTFFREMVHNSYAQMVTALQSILGRQTDGSAKTQIVPPTAQLSARIPIAVTNTAVRFTATSTPTKLIYVEALETNIGKVAIGALSTVSIVAGSEIGLQLVAGEKVPIEIDDLNKLYVNGAASDGIVYLGW